ncbi:uncharacterized protein LOC122513006 [Leptopilina heterotoma]|uniref:uncharacterized protein LOC122513006 n=1 Tax=Leptopilina heterotoma TaxID=63436 RepID=UPI001CAA27CC|nr:uncharacterized protein LOC122513006 [Leptopilina heterotoma]
MFSIIELEDGVVLVPTKWIVNFNNGEQKCYYPPSAKSLKLNDMISKLVDPDVTWKQYDVIKYLKRTDTIETAKEKLQEALVMSEIDSDQVDNYAENYKRSRNNRAKKGYLGHLDDNDEYNSFKKQTKPKISEDKLLESRIVLPLPPSKRIRIAATVSENNIPEKLVPDDNLRTSSEDSMTLLSQKSSQKLKQKESTIKTPSTSSENPKKSSSIERQSRTPKNDSDNYMSNNLNPNSETSLAALENQNQNSKLVTDTDFASPTTSPDNRKKSNNTKPSSASMKSDVDNDRLLNKKSQSNLNNRLASMEYQDRKSGLTYEELSLSKLNEIIILLKNIKIQPQNRTLTINDNRSFFDSSKCPQLPILTKKVLMKVNEELKHKSFKEKMINALGTIGGRDVKNVLANVCTKLFSNKVATFYSWSGRKSKMSLEDTNFADLIIQSVKATYPDEKDHNIKDAGSKWFAQASTRLKRELAKQVDSGDDDNVEDGIPINESEPLQSDADDEEEI